MQTIIYAGWGGAGGGLIEVLLFHSKALEWRSARQALAASTQEVESQAYLFSKYFDWKANGLITLTRVVLGAAAGALFTMAGQISGVYGAVVVGAAAPALLAQLGQSQAVQHAVGDQKPRETPDRPRIEVSPAVLVDDGQPQPKPRRRQAASANGRTASPTHAGRAHEQ